MKKIDVVLLGASLCLLFGNVLNLLNIFYDIPLWLEVLGIPALLVSIVLYGIVLKRQLKNKKKKENEPECKDGQDLA